MLYEDQRLLFYSLIFKYLVLAKTAKRRDSMVTERTYDFPIKFHCTLHFVYVDSFNIILESSWNQDCWGEISITSDIQMTPPLWQKAKKN